MGTLRLLIDGKCVYLRRITERQAAATFRWFLRNGWELAR
jgi:hypothetical protein